MELCWFILRYEAAGNQCTEYFPSVFERSRRERELKEFGVEFSKEKQTISV